MLAAIQPTVPKMLDMTRSHAMAMPLDYFVARVVSKVGTTEFVMRFPAAIWGTLTIAVVFVLIRQWVNSQTAIGVALLLSLSPTHIRYSQELRFYSALCFFYLLSNVALYRALRQWDKKRLVDWGIYVLVTFVGTYFHPYVVLSIANGFFSLLFLRLSRPHFLRLMATLTVCGLILGVLFIPGYLYFGAHQVFHSDLLPWGYALPEVILQGIGWYAFHYTEATPMIGPWEILNMGFAGLGVLAICVWRKRYLGVFGPILGILSQMAFIVSADWVKGYWFSARQVIHLMPVPLLLTAIGGASLLEWLNHWGKALTKHKFSEIRRYCLPLTLAAAVCLSAAPEIRDYYRFQKSTGKQIVSQLLPLHKPGEPILIIPGYDWEVFQIYLMQAHSDDKIKDLKPTSWQELPALVSETPSGALYLVTPAKLSNEEKATLETLGFTNLSGPDKLGSGAHALHRADATPRREP